MQPVGLVLNFPLVWPPQGGALQTGRAFARVYQPLLTALEEHPAVRAVVHLSGPLLEWMETEAPASLRTLLSLVGQGRVELCGGPWGGGLLPALPERDAVGQIQATTRWWKARCDQRIRGAWLPYCGWDPAAARILGRLGLQYTFLEDAQFHPPLAADGYVLTEREGQGLALFVSDTRLASLVPDAAPAKLVRALAMRAAEGRRCVVLTLTGEALGAADDEIARRCFGGPDAWVPRFFRDLTTNSHWIKPFTAGGALDRLRPSDRAWPPPGITLPVAVAALGGERAADFAEVIDRLRAGRDDDLARWAPFLRAGAWEGLLAHHPEVNRLHKRMLRASLEVLRLRTAVREGGGDRDPRLLAMEEATLSLYRGQLGAAYVLGADTGAQDGALRHHAYENLLRAERVVAFALGEGDGVRRELVDYDCDGRPEVIVRTPAVCAVVAPSAGGALVELDAWGVPGNVLNVRTRRPEPEHAGIVRQEALPCLAVEPDEPGDPDAELDEVRTDVRTPPSARISQRGLADHVHHDRHVRASFLDHFFGPDVSAHNLRLGRYPEVGDFVGADYQLLQVEDTPEGGVLVAMGRDGGVTEGSALRLMRIVKRFEIHPTLPLLDVRYEVINRYQEPVRTRFGVELNLNLDSHVGDLIGLEIGAERFPLLATGERADVSEVVLTDVGRGLRLRVGASLPGRLCHHPIETVSRSPRGVARQYQGVSLVWVWPVELWGLERQRLDLSLSVEG